MRGVIVFNESLPLNQTINQQIYKQIMWHVAAGQIAVTSIRQWTSSECLEYSAVPGRDEHQLTETTSLSI